MLQVFSAQKGKYQMATGAPSLLTGQGTQNRGSSPGVQQGGPLRVSFAPKSHFCSDAVQDPKPPARVPLQKAHTLAPRKKQPHWESHLSGWDSYQVS